MKKLLTLTWIWACLAIALQAQPIFEIDLNPNDHEHDTQYFFNQYLYNPAFAGIATQPVFMTSARRMSDQGGENFLRSRPAIYHAQWSNFFPEASSGFGAQFTYFKPRSNTLERVVKVAFSYAYEYALNDRNYFRFGPTVSILNVKDSAIFNNPGNQSGTNAPTPAINEQPLKVDLDLGFLFLRDDRHYFGFSMHNVRQTRFQFFDNRGRQTFFRRRGFLTAGTEVYLGDITIYPSLMLSQYMGKGANSTVAGTSANGRNVIFNRVSARLDINALVNFRDNVLLGITGKVFDPNYVLGLTVGGRIAKQWQLMFSYNVAKAERNPPRSFQLSLGYFIPFEIIEDEE